MTGILGLNCKLYRNSGTWASPVWQEVDLAREVTLNLEAAEADATVRAGAGWRETMAGLKDATIECELRYDKGDGNIQKIRQAYFDGTAIEMLALDGPVTDNTSEGLRGEFYVTSFSRGDPLEDIVTVSVTLKVKSSTNPPVWFTPDDTTTTV